jgi:ubiquitin-protein ligase
MNKSEASKTYSQYFRRYELLIEYKNLKNPSNCPPGVYCLPREDNLNIWDGVVFVQPGGGGYYENGIFRFLLQIPEEYPAVAPSVKFISEMFHPLINSSGYFVINHRFPEWIPRKHFISHLLHYISDMFTPVGLTELEEVFCPNKESFHLLNTNLPLFKKRAAQIASLSCRENVLMSSDNGGIHFQTLSDSKFEEIKAQIN